MGCSRHSPPPTPTTDKSGKETGKKQWSSVQGTHEGKRRACEGFSFTGVHPSTSWGPWGLTLHPSGLPLRKQVAE